MRRHSLIVIALIFLPLATNSALAYEDSCKSPSNTPEQFTCSRVALTKADSELNKAYKDLLKRIDAQYEEKDEINARNALRKKITETQRNWIALRDSDCELEVFEIEYGSIAYEISKNYCITDRSSERVNYLNSLFKNLSDLIAPPNY